MDDASQPHADTADDVVKRRDCRNAADTGADIAVVGIGCRFPGADDHYRFWQNLAQGKSHITAIPEERGNWQACYSADPETPNASISRWCGLLSDGIDRFDNRFFNITPQEAVQMDPHQRLLLEESWHCIEDSGIALEVLQQGRTSVFIGITEMDYYLDAAMAGVAIDRYACLGNFPCFTANRISHAFGLTGQSMSLDAACASSLSAINEARQTLLSGASDYAMAGAACLVSHPWKYISFSKARVLSPKGRCKTFDADADGFVPGEGAGILLLQRLADARNDRNRIYGVIKGISVRHTGRAPGLTVPQVASQKAVILDAMASAGIDAGTVSYVEAHGTGTPLGDPIEIEALTQAFHKFTDQKQFCRIGSVKTNIGHLGPAAGLAGIIKVLGMMRHRYIVPSLHFQQPNPMIPFAASPFQVAVDKEEWRAPANGSLSGDTLLRAGVSAFGLGGTNSHLILEAPPAAESGAKRAQAGSSHLFLLSARTRASLLAMASEWRIFINGDRCSRYDLSDICATLATGRREFCYRLGGIARSKADIRELLNTSDSRICRCPDLKSHLHIGGLDWDGFHRLHSFYQDNPQFVAQLSATRRQLQDTAVAGFLEKGLFNDRWETENASVFSLIVGHALIMSFFDMGFSPVAITFEQPGSLLALTISGMISLVQAVTILCGSISRNTDAGCQALSRPRIPVYNPTEAAFVHPFTFSAGNVRDLRFVLARMGGVADAWIEKGMAVRAAHPAFRKYFKDWVTALEAREVSPGLMAALRDGATQNALERNVPAPERRALAVMMKETLDRYSAKWQLSDAAASAASRAPDENVSKVGPSISIQALVDLIHDGVLPKSDFVDLSIDCASDEATMAGGADPSNDDSRVADIMNSRLERLDFSKSDIWLKKVLQSNELFVNVDEWIHRNPKKCPPLLAPGEKSIVFAIGECAYPPHCNAFYQYDFQTNCPEDAERLLLELWQNGGAVRWDKKYQTGSYRKVGLPVYCFQGERFWREPSIRDPEKLAIITSNKAYSAATEETASENTPQENDFEEYRFSYQFSGKEFFFRDHRLNGWKVLPGVMILEALWQEGLRVFKNSTFEISQVVWRKPFVMAHEARTLDFVMSPEISGSHRLFRCESRENGHIEVYATGTLKKRPASAAAPPPVDIGKIRSRCPGLLKADACYQHFSGIGLSYGSSFQTLGQVQYGAAEALGDLTAVLENGGADCGLCLDPGLLDGALQTIAGICHDAGEAKKSYPYLPFSLQTFQVFRDLPTQCRVHLEQLENDREENNRHVNITVTTLTGEVVLIMKTLVFRQLAPTGKHPEADITQELYAFRRKWIPESIEDQSPLEIRHLLVFETGDRLSDAFLRDGVTDVYCVQPGDGFLQKGSGVYEVNPEDSGDYIRLIEQLPVLRELIVLHAWSLDDGHNSRPSAILDRGVHSLFLLSRAILSGMPEAKVQLMYVYPGELTGRYPFHAATGGFVRSVNLERTRFHWRTMAVAPVPGKNNPDEMDAFLAHIKQEFQSGRLSQPELRIFKGGRQILVQEPISLPGADPGRPVLRRDGVYLITGGAGGIGLSIARYLSVHTAGHIILTGRSGMGEAVRAIRTATRANVEYRVVDMNRPGDVEQLVADIRKELGGLHGVFHCAGILRDAYIQNKRRSDFLAVLAPKVHGLLYLDKALGTASLDFMVLFSSVSGMLGNPAQCDYAYANRFMDHFARFRNGRRQEGQRHGKTLSIAWPLWDAGGMSVDDQTLAYMEATLGQRPMPSALGIGALFSLLGGMHDTVSVFYGDKLKIHRALAITDKKMPDDDSYKSSRQLSQPSPEGFELGGGNTDSVTRIVRRTLADIVSEMLSIDPSQIDPGEPLQEYGFDSIGITEFTTRINALYSLDLPPALYFEYPSIRAMADHLVENQIHALSAFYGLADTPCAEDDSCGGILDSDPLRHLQPIIKVDHHDNYPDNAAAIIGMAGVFPQAGDIETFWEHLINGRDLIRTIPRDRWDWRLYDGDPLVQPNKTASKWGGFMPHVDRFDAAFFGISPREADVMDPQHRLFMEVVWHTLEDAGYNAENLSGSDTGIFVGVSNSDYEEMLRAAGMTIQAHTATGMITSILPNRISYFFDWHGPSEPVDTACSSSLVAIHRAVKALQNRECSLAVAGGVNVILRPTLHIAFSRAGMLSPTGRCRSFDAGADGYVRGEGAGAILIKPLGQAIADGDHIHGVILGTAVNHGGRAGSLTAPNPNLQAKVIAKAFGNAEINPEQIDYIEAHGTGTVLGDPVEFNGLKQAFQNLAARNVHNMPNENSCGIGTVKTHIGHLETAAGIAGVIKTLMAMKHKILPGMLHFNSLNPQIILADSPFYIVDRNKPWRRKVNAAGQPVPLLAGVNAFGFGGANAHIVLSEAPLNIRVTGGPEQDTPQLLVLSAGSVDQLKQYAVKLRQYFRRLQKDGNGLKAYARMADIAFTLQMGRKPMAERLAILAGTPEEAIHRLTAYLEGNISVSTFTGAAEDENPMAEMFFEGPEGDAYLKTILTERKLEKVAQLWVSGMSIDWRQLHSGRKLQRIPLPTYPFARERHWLKTASSGSNDSEPRQPDASGKEIQPLIDIIDPSISLHDGLTFIKEYRSDEPLVRDHRVNGENVLPGAAYVEMVFEAMSSIRNGTVVRLKHIHWLIPFVVNGHNRMSLTITEKNRAFTFICSSKKNGCSITHAKGEAEFVAASDNAKFGKIPHGSKDVEKGETVANERSLPSPHLLMEKCRRGINPADLYDMFDAQGITYGPVYRCVREVHADETQAACRISETGTEDYNRQGLFVDPTLLDGAFQGIAGLLSMDELRNPLVPFAVQSVDILKPVTREIMAYVCRDGNRSRFHVTITDPDGDICLCLKGLELRPLHAMPPGMLYVPKWVHEEMKTDKGDTGKQVLSAPRRVLLVHSIPRGSRGDDWPTYIRLFYSGCQVTEILLGNVRRQHSDGCHEVNAADKKALSLLLSGDNQFDCVYFFGPSQFLPEECCSARQVTDEKTGKGKFPNHQILGLFSFFRLIRTFYQNGQMERNFELKLLTDMAHPVLPDEDFQPHGAALHGLALSLAAENPNLSVSVTDVAFHAPVDSRAFAVEPGPCVSFRSGRRYVRRLFQFEAPSAVRMPFRKQGVYVIAGGAGGIGLVTAEYLARTAQARLALIGRRNPDVKQQERMNAITACGGEVMYVRADITDANSLERAAREIRDRFGQIHGVIHSAIVLDDALLRNMDEKQFRSVIDPKIKGSCVLSAAFQDDSLDFMAFFSSVQSFSPNAGQGNYAAGCLFKDSFASWLDNRKAYPVITINWGYWGTVGVVASAKYRKRLSAKGIYAIEPDAGMAAFKLAVSESLRQLAVLKADHGILKNFQVDNDHTIQRLPDNRLPGRPPVDRTDAVPETAFNRKRIDLSPYMLLESYGLQLLLQYFQGKGFFRTGSESYSMDGLQHRMGILDRHTGLFRTFLQMLASGGWVLIDGEAVTSTPSVETATVSPAMNERAGMSRKNINNPALHHHASLLRYCAASYDAVLSGRRSPAEVMFAGEVKHHVAGIYRGHPLADHCNQQLAEVVKSEIVLIAQQAKNAPAAEHTVRLLEVGAGTGGTTRAVIAELKKIEHPLNYHFTDVSSLFLKSARKQYQPVFPFVTFGRLDIEKDPCEQGYTVGEFDIVICANVLHATRRISQTLSTVKSLLKPGGAIVLLELTGAQHFASLTFGLLPGWWSFEDSSERLPGTPLLDLARWKRVLYENGFTDFHAWGAVDDDEGRVSQHVMVCRSDGDIVLPKHAVEAPANTTDKSNPEKPEQDAPSGTTKRDAVPKLLRKIGRPSLETLHAAILDGLSRVLEIDAAALDPDTPFTEFGVDSILAVELIEDINSALDIDLSATDLFDHATIRELCNHISEIAKPIAVPKAGTLESVSAVGDPDGVLGESADDMLSPSDKTGDVRLLELLNGLRDGRTVLEDAGRALDEFIG